MDIGWLLGIKLWLDRKNKCLNFFYCVVIINNII